MNNNPLLKKRGRASIAVLALLLSLCALTAYPSFCTNSTVDLTTVDLYIGNQLNVGEFGGGILLTLVFTSMWIFPLIFAKSDKILVGSIFIGFASLSACVAFTWCPVWVLVVAVFLVALGFGGRIKDAVTNG